MNIPYIAREQAHRNITSAASCLIALFLPLSKSLPVIFTVILAINWITTPGTAKRLRAIHERPLVFLLASLFFAGLIGMIYTSDIREGLSYLRNWFLILVFALVYGTTPLMEPKELRLVLLSFLAGSVAACAYAVIAQVLDVASSAEGLGSFFHHSNAYTNFTQKVDFHPAYFSMYLLFSICILYYYARYEKRTLLRLGTVIVFCLLLFSIVYAASRNQIIQAVILINVLVILSVSPWKSFKRLAVLLGANCLLVALILNTTYAKQRLQLIWNPKISQGATDTRYDRWAAAIEIVKEHPILGVGTGDSAHELELVYQKNELQNALEHKYNVHNAFLEAAVQLGILGALLFAATLIYPFLRSFQCNSYLYALFLLIFILSILTESMLNRQKGVFFYAFFNAFLCFQYSNQLRRDDKFTWLTLK